MGVYTLEMGSSEFALSTLKNQKFYSLPKKCKVLFFFKKKRYSNILPVDERYNEAAKCE